jgi:hypothetical protein
LQRPTGTPLLQLGTRELGAQADFSAIETYSPVRSVYLPDLRGKLPEMLALFDMADPSLTTGKRDTTSGPDQALFLLNSPFIAEQSQAFARRVLGAAGSDDRERIDLAFRVAVGKKPTEPQIAVSRKFLSSIRTTIQAERGPEFSEADVNLAAWSQLCQTLLSLPEFRYVF